MLTISWRRIIVPLLMLSSAHGTDSAALEVRFKLTDVDNQPLLATPVRVVFGAAPGWQQAGAGERFTTDAAGEHRFTTSAVIEKRSRKVPTNFVDSLFSRAKPTDFLSIATELEYAGRRRLYVIELHRFADGTVLREGFSIYTPDARGDFTNQGEFVAAGWKMADLGGTLLTGPGNEIANAALEPDANDPTEKRWILTLWFKRSPAPVMR